MDGIKLWISSLSAVTFIMAVIAAVAPKNTAGRVCVMLGEILLISVLISPAKKVLGGSVPDFEGAYRAEVEETAFAATEACNELEAELIRKKLSAYVLNRAETTGELDIELSDKTPVSAEGTVRDSAAAVKVKAILSGELGVPEEKQKIKVEEK